MSPEQYDRVLKAWDDHGYKEVIAALVLAYGEYLTEEELDTVNELDITLEAYMDEGGTLHITEHSVYFQPTAFAHEITLADLRQWIGSDYDCIDGHRSEFFELCPVDAVDKYIRDRHYPVLPYSGALEEHEEFLSEFTCKAAAAELR